MLSIDTNILFYAFASDRAEHHASYSWLSLQNDRKDVVLSEFVLVEFYRLLRNPVVVKNPLSAAEAAGVIQTYRNHPNWRVLGFNKSSQNIHDQLWNECANPSFAYKRIYDARLAMSLIDFGVKEFATRNRKDFINFAFDVVSDPLSES